MTLYQLSEQERAISEALEENGGELTPEIEALMVENAELFPKKIDGYGVMLRKFKALEENCDSEAKRIQAIKKTAQNAQKNMREHILNTMVQFGFDKLEGATTKMWVGKSKSLEVDEEELLAQYKDKIDALNECLPDYLTVEVKVSKKTIKDQFKGDVMPAGCSISENETLTIK